jgi:two-component system, cell cycle sensor histidine kinase and response regulator CckA
MICQIFSVKQLPLAVFAADNEGRLRFRLPLVTYTNRYTPDASTVWMSPQVEAVTGYRAEEWVGKPGFFERILHPDDRAPVLEDMRVSRERFRAFSRDYRLQARDGKVVWIHDESIPVLDKKGSPEFIQGYFVDITERKRLEEALRHAQKIEAVGRLAGGIAHDFNNLLTAIAGYSALAEKQLPAAHGAQRYLREISRTVQRAVRLTRQLLAFSRRQELDPQVFDLGRVVRGMESMLLHVAGDGVEVDFELCESAQVYADMGEIEQVLMNLVANARDAIAGGGRISIRTATVDVAHGAESQRLGVPAGEYAVLITSDTGCGMDTDTQALVFDPFFTTKERGAGTGLGLSMVQGIIRQSGGAIDVTSSPGVGTTFRILLPLAGVG